MHDETIGKDKRRESGSNSPVYWHSHSTPPNQSYQHSRGRHQRYGFQYFFP